jgi:WD40 repeat protein
MTTGQDTLTLKGHTGHVLGLVFSPNGQRIATASYDDGTVRVWDAATGREMLTLRVPVIGGFYGVAFSPDGAQLAAAGQDGVVRVWDAVTGRITLNLKGHAGAVYSVAFSPDGSRIASGGADQMAKVWDAVTGQEVLTLNETTGAMTAVAFSPDGSRLVACQEGGTLSVWDARAGDTGAIPGSSPAAAPPPATATPAPNAHPTTPAVSGRSSVDNLWQISAALHDFVKTNNFHFPADVRGRDGKSLLSWRVRLLPFLEQQALFDAIRLDEPWDGPHNKILLGKMPPVFATPNSSVGPGLTFYRGFSGKRTLFDPGVKEGVPASSVSDGLSFTIAMVEAKEAVPWTKPESDLAFDEGAKPERLKALFGELGGHIPGGFIAVFGDGSIKSVRSTVNPSVLRGLITRDGGEKLTIRPNPLNPTIRPNPSGPLRKIPAFDDFDEKLTTEPNDKSMPPLRPVAPPPPVPSARP